MRKAEMDQLRELVAAWRRRQAGFVVNAADAAYYDGIDAGQDSAADSLEEFLDTVEVSG